MTAQWFSEPHRPTDLPWFFDAPWDVANQRDRHQFIYRAGQTRDLPGSPASKVTASFGVTTLARPSERGFLHQLIYGDPSLNDPRVSPPEMCGLARHYSSRDPAEAQNSVNVLDASGTNNLCSIWLVGWGPRTLFMVSPDGQPPHYGGECCLCVADWRYVVRVANTDAVAPDFDVLGWLAKASLQVPSLGPSERVRPIFYVTGDVENLLSDAIGSRADGPYVGYFRNIPIRRVDELRSDEARV